MTAEISSRPLGLTRIIVGGASALRAVVAWPILNKLSRPGAFRVPYADWLPEPSPGMILALVAVWLVAGILFAVGWRVGFVGPVLLLAIAVHLVLDQQTYDNHVYMMAWLIFLLTMANAGSGLSLGQDDRPIVRWPVVLIMIQLSVVYGFSGLTKLNSTFLSGAGLAGVLHDGIVPFPDVLRTPGVFSVMAVLVVFVELCVAIMIWRPLFRHVAFVLGLALHVAITLLMASTLELLVFSLEMLALYPLFLCDDGVYMTIPEGSQSKRRIQRFDLLRLIDFQGVSEELTVFHCGEVATGASAHTRILEHLVPWLWVAPILRLPYICQLREEQHQKVHRRPGPMSDLGQ